jgi:exodeoxyribonuclease VII large subunit
MDDEGPCIIAAMRDEAYGEIDAQGRDRVNLPEFSVSEISGLIKGTVEEAFPYVRVRGEISSAKRHTSGHCYIDLKDERACLAAVVWKTGWNRLKVKPEQGLDVVCTGRITTFAGQSKYQLVIEQIELAGLGALMAMLEARRKKLAAEGLFDEARKKPLPYLPSVVGVVTSPTGAVLRDILHRLRDRFPRHVLLWPVAVQGERAASEVAAAIRGFDALKAGGLLARPDVLIVARGGGSVEDLMAFNEEIVVRAAAECSIPLISAVGHETDTTLIDYASDRRAPTPTAAAEMAVPVLRELLGQTQELSQRLFRAATRIQNERRQFLTGLARALPRADSLFALPRQRFDSAADRLPRSLTQNLARHRSGFERAATLLRPRVVSAQMVRGKENLTRDGARLKRAFERHVEAGRKALSAHTRVLESVSYRAVLARGFALVRAADGTVRRRAVDVAEGETLRLTFVDGERETTAKGGGTPEKLTAKPRKPTGNQGDLF